MNEPELDQRDEQFCRWAQELPKPAAGDSALRASLAVALAEQEKQPKLRWGHWQIGALAACWIATTFFYLGSTVERGPTPPTFSNYPAAADDESESAQLLADLYPRRSPFQLNF